MASSDTKLAENQAVGSTKEFVEALIVYLLDPLLPSRVSDITPSQDHQISVAKQMHAVVLLYNYYHRKQNPEVVFLEFVHFCKMVALVRPQLAAFIKPLMQNESIVSHCIADYDHLSVTEKAIKNACDIAAALDASKDVPDIKDWPVSKVAVLMVDASKENCWLQFGLVTQGVWAPIEKEVNEPSESMEASGQLKVGNKRTRSGQKVSIGDVYLKQLAYDAVKDAAGYDSGDLKVLETHVTYSLTKYKSATRLYVMQYCGSFSINQEVPLKYIVESLQESFIKKLSFELWETTRYLEYHHMLPYLEFISCWLSGGFSGEVIVDNNVMEKYNEKKSMVLGTSVKDEESRICDETLGEGNVVEFYQRVFPGSSKELHERNLSFFPKTCLENEHPIEKMNQEVKAYHHQTNNDLSMQNEGHVTNDGGDHLMVDVAERLNDAPDDVGGHLKVDAHAPDHLDSDYRPCKDDEKVSGIKIDATAICNEDVCVDRKHAKEEINQGVKVYHNDEENDLSVLNDVHATDDGGGHLEVDADDGLNSDHQDLPSLSDEHLALLGAGNVNVESETALPPSEEFQIALALLDGQRQQLHSQLCNLEDKLEVCEEHIERIRDGGEVALARRCIKSILSGNYDLLLPEMRGKQNENNSEQNNPQIYLPGKSPCEDLDHVCIKNNWRLPRYFIVVPSCGKFLSRVVVKVKNLELSTEGNLETKPSSARESAAAQMIAKIQSSFT